MTRITNFGRKRTHVQAGFTNDALVEPAEPQASTSTLPSEAEPHGQVPPKKKRKRTEQPDESGDNDGESARSTEGRVQDAVGSEQAKVAPKTKLKGQRKIKSRSIIASNVVSS
jgi:zinc finger CCHC domain-containing protein 9